MEGVLGKDFVLRSLFRSTGGLGAQFRCQLHPCALMLIFGSCAGSSDICFGLWLGCLADWRGFSPVGLELIIAGGGTLVGKNVAMGLLVGPGNHLVRDFSLISLAYWVILLVLVMPYWMVPLSFAIILSPFARKKPTWRLPAGGHVHGIIASFGAFEHKANSGCRWS